MIRSLLVILAITFFIGCSVTQENPQPRTVIMTIDGNVSEVEVVGEHPCEGNWNFCDYVDEYRSYTHPEF
jgi:hypothetical protein